MCEFKCHTIIFSSSATIYGNNKNNPILEDKIKNFLMPR